MKRNKEFTVNLIIFSVLVTAQIVYFLLPAWLIVSFNYIFRPMLYACILAACLVLSGRDERPVSKGTKSVLLACIGVVIYYTGLLLTGIIYGLSRNVMVSSIWGVFDNIWTSVTVLIMSEFLRIRLIKGTSSEHLGVNAVFLTLVYTFIQLDNLYVITNSADFSTIIGFFLSIMFPVLALNAVLTYMAFNGTFAAVLLMRCVYSLSPVLLPVLPNVSKIAWAAISCVLLFITVIIYHRQMNGGTGHLRFIEKRRAKYQKKSVAPYLVFTIAFALLIAFILRVFPYFPVVVLTNSMTGTFDRGCVAIVEKMRSEEIPKKVDEGTVILYKYNTIEKMHRVTELRYNHTGELVYLTKGDANPIADYDPVEISQVIGISRKCVPYIGYPVLIVNTILRRG